MKMNRPHVLIVDDNSFIRLSLNEFLIEKGFDVDLAEDGETCLKMFDSKQFDFVVMDYRLPNINGLKMAEEIKRKNPEAVIIMMSGDSQMKLQMTDAADYFLEKPFKYEDIYKIMSRADEFEAQRHIST